MGLLSLAPALADESSDLMNRLLKQALQNLENSLSQEGLMESESLGESTEERSALADALRGVGKPGFEEKLDFDIEELISPEQLDGLSYLLEQGLLNIDELTRTQIEALLDYLADKVLEHNLPDRLESLAESFERSLNSPENKEALRDLERFFSDLGRDLEEGGLLDKLDQLFEPEDAPVDPPAPDPASNNEDQVEI